jgi:hypothetical protein
VSLRQTYGSKFDPAKDYMTSVEKTLFKDMRDAGSISVFKMGSCVVCGDDVIKGKKFCSRECKEKDYEARELD